MSTKKYCYLFACMAATMSLTCLIACNKDDETDDKNIIQQNTVNPELKDFFKRVFPNEAHQSLYDFESDADTVVRVVTNLEDFETHYSGGSYTIPYLNFDKYVLVCGKVIMPNCPYYVKSLKIRNDVSGSRLIVNTTKPDAQWTVVYHMGFWGLFPKNQYDITSVEVIKE